MRIDDYIDCPDKPSSAPFIEESISLPSGLSPEDVFKIISLEEVETGKKITFT
jgi:hypothetical protein